VAEPTDVHVVVSQVHINELGLEVSFMVVPTGVRNIAGQPVALVNVLQVALDHPSYGEQVKRLIKDVETLVADVMDDYEDAPVFAPYEPDPELDDDDEDRPTGMGYP
jgi:hypothetical protein